MHIIFILPFSILSSFKHFLSSQSSITNHNPSNKICNAKVLDWTLFILGLSNPYSDNIENYLGAIWICCFPSPITLFSSPITQNWWIPWLKGLFEFVFSFCFYHSIFWFLSDELWKLKTHFRCFQVIKTGFPWHFGK